MEFDEALEAAIPSIAIRLEGAFIVAAPVDTGRLKNSIRVIPSKNGVTLIIVEYAMFVEFGSIPHVITAKSGKKLHWHKTKGRTQHSHPHSKAMAKDAVYAKEVRHPGTRPNPFIRNTINNKLPKIIEEEVSKFMN